MKIIDKWSHYICQHKFCYWIIVIPFHLFPLKMKYLYIYIYWIFNNNNSQKRNFKLQFYTVESDEFATVTIIILVLTINAICPPDVVSGATVEFLDTPHVDVLCINL